jgi:hypothetical protein
MRQSAFMPSYGRVPHIMSAIKTVVKACLCQNIENVIPKVKLNVAISQMEQ